MLAAVRSAALAGIEAFEITVEVHVAAGLPQFSLVGLAAGAVKESRERVTAALANIGLPVPPRRIVVNLSPADTPKSGTGFDLPIALGILAATGAVPAEALADTVFLGEVALDGALRPVRGALPVAHWAARAGHRLVVPPGNVAEAGRVRRLALAAPPTLAALVADLRAGTLAPATPIRDAAPAPTHDDFADVVGQGAAKRALEIAAAGAHNVLLVGPPGAGKTMLARRLPSILPALDDDEALEVLAIRSVAGLPAPAGAVERPFRAPHHTVSVAGLVGGGSPLRPGEVTLAHHGVLLFDEVAEASRYTLDTLRQPLEDGVVAITRAHATVTFPARFTLVAAMNPCPCGHAGAADGGGGERCRCAPADIERYQARLSGPLADRIDLHLRLAAVPPRAIAAAGTPAEPSRAVRARVEAARARQRARYAGVLPGVTTNAGAPGRWVELHGQVCPAARDLLVTAAERLAVSARAFYRTLRVARTIADLAGSEVVEPVHVAEALQSRGTHPRPAALGPAAARAAERPD